jgi:uncharacterized protein (UPF0335 family)
MAESIAGDQLRSLIERIERLEEEKAERAADIREVYAEAKGNGFDTKAMRKVVALRRLDAAERREQEAVLATYMQALGMLADTPLGRAAMPKRARDDETKMSLEVPGMEPVHFTAADLKRATAALETKDGRRAFREAAGITRP